MTPSAKKYSTTEKLDLTLYQQKSNLQTIQLKTKRKMYQQE
jgi:hypothetical protein